MAAKVLKVLAGAMALSMVLTACGAGTDSSSNSGSPSATKDASSNPSPSKNVTFSIIYATGDPATKQAMAEAVDGYTKAHPNVKITNLSEGGGTASYLDFLKTKDAVGEFPDLVEMRDTAFFSQAGKLAELPEELQPLFNDIPKLDGKVWVAPITGTAPQGIIYSKKAYTDAGVTAEPKTYDEFLAIQDKLKAKGITPITMGGKDIFHWGFWVNKFLMDEVFAADPNWNSKRTKGEVSFTDAGPMKAMQSLNELFTKGYIDKGYMSTADNQTASLLVTGKAAELFSGPWMFPQIQQADPKFDFGWYPVPDRKGNIVVSGLNGPTGWALSAKSAQDPDKKAAIVDFIKFFFTKDQYGKWLKSVSGISTTKVPVTYDASPQMKRVLEVMADPKTIKSAQINAFWGENQMPPQWRNWYYKLIQDWLAKGDFSADYMKKADAEWNTDVKANAASK